MGGGNIISLRGIQQVWDVQNRDMQNYLALTADNVNATCGLGYGGFVNLMLEGFCPVATIAEKYNLTLEKYNTSRGDQFGDRSFGIVITTFMEITELDDRHFMYGLHLVPVHFVAVTKPAAPGSGMETFFTIFDSETWTGVLLIVTSVAGYLSWLQFKCDWFEMFLPTVITVLSILLGQVGDSAGKGYQKMKVALIIVILWFFLDISSSWRICIRDRSIHVWRSSTRPLLQVGLRISSTGTTGQSWRRT